MQSQIAAFETKGKISPEMAEMSISSLSLQINANPTQGELYHQRGTLYMLSKKEQLASNDFSKSIELKSDMQADSYFYRALVKQSLNDATYCDDFAMAKKLGFKNTAGWEPIDKICGF